MPQTITIALSANNSVANVSFVFSTSFTSECTYFYMVDFLDGNSDLLFSFLCVLTQEELTAGLFVITPDSLLAGLEQFEPGVGINVTLSVDEDSISNFTNVPGGKMAVSGKQA